MISGRRKPKAYEQHVASILRELPMSFETPESALAALQEKIAHIDPARSYETSHGRVSGAELRAPRRRREAGDSALLTPARGGVR
jgi:hypothetical protein